MAREELSNIISHRDAFDMNHKSGIVYALVYTSCISYSKELMISIYENIPIKHDHIIENCFDWTWNQGTFVRLSNSRFSSGAIISGRLFQLDLKTCHAHCIIGPKHEIVRQIRVDVVLGWYSLAGRLLPSALRQIAWPFTNKNPFCRGHSPAWEFDCCGRLLWIEETIKISEWLVESCSPVHCLPIIIQLDLHQERVIWLRHILFCHVYQVKHSFQLNRTQMVA